MSRQSTGATTDVGSWAGVGVVQHQVHNVEGAGAEGEGEGAGALDHTELGEEWERQAGWGKAARRRRQVLEDDQEDAPGEAQEDAPAEAQEGAPGEAQEEQIGGSGGTRVQRERAAAEAYEKRQMLWKGMAGRSWTELVQQWGVPQVEALRCRSRLQH